MDSFRKFLPLILVGTVIDTVASGLAGPRGKSSSGMLAGVLFWALVLFVVFSLEFLVIKIL